MWIWRRGGNPGKKKAQTEGVSPFLFTGLCLKVRLSCFLPGEVGLGGGGGGDGGVSKTFPFL